MDRFAGVKRFVGAVRDADSLAAVSAILSDATREFDFDHFALVQKSSRRTGLGAVKLSDFPAAWVERLGATAYYVHDPVLMACEKSVAPFAWDTIPAMFALSKHQRAYMANAQAAGLDTGFTVPIHVPGEASGLCSFVMARGRALPADALPAAQYLACFAFEAARRLAAAGAGPDPVPRLTQRQLDCVVLAARGKSNWVAGQLLGLSPDTVHKYLEAAKRRYGVSTRTELVVRTLYDGELSYGDVLGKAAPMTGTD